MPLGNALPASIARAIPRPDRAALWILCGSVLAATLAAFSVLLYSSQFARYLGDDFCYIASLNDYGFVGSQAFWYTSWSGRFTSNFLETFLVFLGPGITPYVPALALCIWLLACTQLVSECIHLLFGMNSPLASLALSALGLFTLFQTLPILPQALYWQLSLLIHIAPLVFGCIGAVILLYQWRTERIPLPTVAAGILALTFFSGGMSEMYSTLQVSLYGALVVLIAVRYPARKEFRTLLIAGLLGSGAALVLQVLAPGNQLRAAGLPPRPAIGILILETLQYSWVAMAQVVSATWLPLLLGFGASTLIGVALSLNRKNRVLPRRSKAILLLVVSVPLISIGLISLSMVPVVYALSTFPPARALTLPHLILVAGILFWGLVLGRIGGMQLELAPRALYVWLGLTVLYALLFGYVSLGTTRVLLRQIPTAQTFANAWDERNVALEGAARQNIRRVVSFHLENAAGVADLDATPQFWVNQCMARAYGIGKLSTQ